MTNELTDQVKRFWPRDFFLGLYFEYFFVSAAANIIFWRVFLQILDYPKITAGNFYFPHVLTGGILLTLGFAISLIYISKATKFIAAVIGGAGFGLFIDEIGKFITQENNYFYEPAIAIIYLIFVSIFLIIRYFEKTIKFTKNEYVVNSLDMIKEALINNMDAEEKKIALRYLDKADQKNVVVQKLIELLAEIKDLQEEKKNFFIDIRVTFRKKYGQIIKLPYFTNALTLFFVGVSLFNLAFSLINFHSLGSTSEIGVAISSIISGSFVLVGIYALKFAGGKLNTYRMFKISVLVSIFATQFFLFWEQQFTAALGLLVNIVIYSGLQYLIYQEEINK